MGRSSGAVVAIAVVLMAVFIPSASARLVGVIYRQFCSHDRAFVDCVLRAPRADLHPGAVRDDAEADPRDAQERRLPLVQPRLRLGEDLHDTSSRRSATCRAERCPPSSRCCAVSCSPACRRASAGRVTVAFAIRAAAAVGASIERSTKKAMGDIGEVIRKNPAVEGAPSRCPLQLHRQRREHRHGLLSA